MGEYTGEGFLIGLTIGFVIFMYFVVLYKFFDLLITTLP